VRVRRMANLTREEGREPNPLTGLQM
jgi:hypothetical protein